MTRSDKLAMGACGIVCKSNDFRFARLDDAVCYTEIDIKRRRLKREVL